MIFLIDPGTITTLPHLINECDMNLNEYRIISFAALAFLTAQLGASARFDDFT